MFLISKCCQVQHILMCNAQSQILNLLWSWYFEDAQIGDKHQYTPDTHFSLGVKDIKRF